MVRIVDILRDLSGQSLHLKPDSEVYSSDVAQSDLSNLHKSILEAHNSSNLVDQSNLFALQDQYCKICLKICNLIQQAEQERIDGDLLFEITQDFTNIFWENPYNESLLFMYAYSSQKYLSSEIASGTLLSTAFAASLPSMAREEVSYFSLCALCHDLGMVYFKDVVAQSRRLKEHEFEPIKQHVVNSVYLVKDIVPKELHSIVLDVHEREFGQGYPNKKTGNEVHAWSKLLGVCDVYKSLTRPKAFRAEYSPFEAIKIIIKMNRKYFDGKIIKKFLDFISVYPIGSIVQLTTGEIAIVIKSVLDSPSKPIVRILMDDQHRVLNEVKQIDLSSNPFAYIRRCVDRATEKQILRCLTPRGVINI